MDEFETDEPAMQRPITITITLADTDGSTDLLVVHDGLSRGVLFACGSEIRNNFLLQSLTHTLYNKLIL